MPLRETLNSVVESIDGALAALVVARDGISIDEAVCEAAGLDLQLISVEYATLVRDIARAIDVMKLGDLEELLVSTDSSSIVVRVLNSEIFAVLVMKRTGDVGRGRYVLKLKSLDIIQELS